MSKTRGAAMASPPATTRSERIMTRSRGRRTSRTHRWFGRQIPQAPARLGIDFSAREHRMPLVASQNIPCSILCGQTAERLRFLRTPRRSGIDSPRVSDAQNALHALVPFLEAGRRERNVFIVHHHGALSVE